MTRQKGQNWTGNVLKRPLVNPRKVLLLSLQFVKALEPFQTLKQEVILFFLPCPVRQLSKVCLVVHRCLCYSRRSSLWGPCLRLEKKREMLYPAVVPDLLAERKSLNDERGMVALLTNFRTHDEAASKPDFMS